jgi:hypothetical protein
MVNNSAKLGYPNAVVVDEKNLYPTDSKSLPHLPPTVLTPALHLPPRRTNFETPQQTHSSPAPAALSKSPYRKCPGGTLSVHAATRRRRTCDRGLRFNANYVAYLSTQSMPSWRFTSNYRTVVFKFYLGRLLQSRDYAR